MSKNTQNESVNTANNKSSVSVFACVADSWEFFQSVSELAARFDGEWIGQGTLLDSKKPEHDIQFDFHPDQGAKFVEQLHTLKIKNLKYVVEARRLR